MNPALSPFGYRAVFYKIPNVFRRESVGNCILRNCASETSRKPGTTFLRHTVHKLSTRDVQMSYFLRHGTRRSIVTYVCLTLDSSPTCFAFSNLRQLNYNLSATSYFILARTFVPFGVSKLYIKSKYKSNDLVKIESELSSFEKFMAHHRTCLSD